MTVYKIITSVGVLREALKADITPRCRIQGVIVMSTSLPS